MKKLFIAAILAFAGYHAFEGQESKVKPDFDEPYVSVYGRDTCGFTQRMLSDLKESDINYHYFVVDEKPIADRLHTKMRAAGIPTERYNLPVVDVNGSLSVRPASSNVITEYRRKQ